MEPRESSVREFLQVIGSSWVALVSGVIGFVLFMGGAVWGVPAANAVALLAGLVGLLLAGYLVWRKEVQARQADASKHIAEVVAHAREKEELLRRIAANDTAARRVAERRGIIDKLGPSDRAVLKCILRSGPTSINDLSKECERENVAYPNLAPLKVNGIVYQEADSRWNINPAWVEPLRGTICDL